MNISHVRTFLEVVETGNLNKAAERLNVTQSTVSTRLDALEDAVGQTLLVRSRRGAQLTRAGFAFQRHAEVMVRSWELARRELNLPKGFAGLFSFACHFDLWEGAGAAWIEAVRRTRPDLAVEAWPGTAGEIEGWLSSGLCDAALVPDPVSASGVETQELGQESLVQVATVPRAAQAWDPDYIYVDMGSGFRVRHALAWPGEETARITFGASRWALDELLARGGSAYLPLRMVRDHIATGRLFEVEGSPSFSRPLYLVWRTASLEAHGWIPEEADRFSDRVI